MNSYNHCMLRGLALVALSLLLTGCARQDPGLFDTPEAAVQALANLIGQKDEQRTEAIFGPGSYELFRSGDDVADQEGGERVKAMILAEVDFEDFDTDTKIALLGEEEWPWPIPLVRDGQGWRFDTTKGREELLNRRIGNNELWTLTAIHEVVDAQWEYRQIDGAGNQKAFAGRFLSAEGTHDGLYWPQAEGEELSPLGDVLAEPEMQGTDPRPFHGYHYRMLTSRGSSAPGGERDCLDDQGQLSGCFGLLAWPAKYGNSGIMTFVTDQRGIVFQNDLGPDTAQAAAAIESFDPGPEWTPTADRVTDP